MEKNLVIGITALFAALLVAIPLVAAGCGCSRPGAPGVPVAFDCSRTNGTTDNVSFYVPAAENEPKAGQLIAIWARKEVDGAQVPIKNLELSVTLDSEELVSLTTDEDGYAKFTAEEPGTYLIKGGDAEYLVEVAVTEEPKDEEPPETVEAPKPNLSQESPDEASEVSSDYSMEAIATSEGTQDTGADNTLLYLIVIIAAATVIILIFKNGKRKEKGQKQG